ncbi:MAG: regulatory protein RecX [Elusimicrobia bacterium]|nr:regulatory protein RecX [Elusimicrobiota bacterium]
MPAKKASVLEGPDRLAMDSALTLLKFRGRSEAELAKRLSQKRYEAGVVLKTINRLRELGLLNDEAIAREWAQARRRAGQGELRIRQTLFKRGIPKELVETVLAEEAPPEEAQAGQTEPERAWTALERRAKRVKALDRRSLYRRLAGYLSRQGFPPDVVHDVLERYFLKLKSQKEEEFPS